MRKQGELGTGGSQGEAMLSETALGCHWPQSLSAVTFPGARTDTVRLRESSTQHVRGKQFIFLPQLFMGSGGGGWGGDGGGMEKDGHVIREKHRRAISRHEGN